MALGGYGPILAGQLQTGPLPPAQPGGVGGAVPPVGASPPTGFPAGSSPPFRIYTGGQPNPNLPSWLQDKINIFNQMHATAVAGRPPIQSSGPGWMGAQFGAGGPHAVVGVGGGTNSGLPTGRPPNWPADQPWPPPWWHGGGPPGGPPPTGPPGPPVGQPPDWHSYWEQWYRQRQPYADWLGGYVRGQY